MIPDAFDRADRNPLFPLHASFLSGSVPLFLGALFSDWAYYVSYEVQWKNFASWLIAGGLIFCGFALLWPLVEVLRSDRRAGRPLFRLILLVTAWALGFTNALVHAKDAWDSMPNALILSALIVLLTLAATWLGLTQSRLEDTR